MNLFVNELIGNENNNQGEVCKGKLESKETKQWNIIKQKSATNDRNLLKAALKDK